MTRLQLRIRASVLDSISIRGMTYYEVYGFNFTYEYGYNFLRSDYTGKLFGLREADSSEVMLYNFTASVGDTWSFPAQLYNARVIVQREFLNGSGSVHTPAGTFDHVVDFVSYFENVGSIILERFAPNVGMISTAAKNEYWVLKEARINGKIFPDSTIVGVKEKAWRMIKAHYWERNFNKKD